MPDDAARRPDGHHDRRSGATRSSTCSRPGRTPDVGRPVHAGATSRPRRTSRSSSRSQADAALDRAALRLGGPRRAATKLCGDGRRPARSSSAAGCGSPRRSTRASRRSPRNGSRPRPSCRNAKDPTAAAKALGFKTLEPWMAQPARQGPPQRRAGRARLPDRRARRLRRQRRLLRDVEQARSSSRSSTSSATAIASPVRRSSRSTTSTGINDKTITAGTMLMDVGDGLRRRLHAERRRQPRARAGARAQRPPVLAQHPGGQDDGHQQRRPRLRQGHRSSACSSRASTTAGRPVARPRRPGGPAGRPRDGVRHARQRRQGRSRHTTILRVKDASGTERARRRYEPPAGTQVVSPQAAYIVTDILAGNTNPSVNPFWGKFAIDRTRTARRPATLKTGTNNDAKDLNAYGYIAPPTEPGRAGRRVRARRRRLERQLGQHAWSRRHGRRSSRSTSRPTSGRASSRRPARSGRSTNFKRRPDGLVRAKIDPLTGLQPSSDSTRRRRVVHRETEPKERLAPDKCGIDVVVHGQRRDAGSTNWMKADRDWLRRAERAPASPADRSGPGRPTSTTGGFHPYGASWGRSGRRACGEPGPSPTLLPVPTPDAERRRPVLRAADAGRLGARRHSPARRPARARRRARSRRSSRPSRRPRSHHRRPSRRRADARRRRRRRPRADPHTDARAHSNARAPPPS